MYTYHIISYRIISYHIVSYIYIYRMKSHDIPIKAHDNVPNHNQNPSSWNHWLSSRMLCRRLELHFVWVGESCHRSSHQWILMISDDFWPLELDTEILLSPLKSWYLVETAIPSEASLCHILSSVNVGASAWGPNQVFPSRWVLHAASLNRL
jgi:hypothetical protein